MSHLMTEPPTRAAGVTAPERVSARTVALLSLAVALVASIPSWFIGFSSDDLTHRLLLEGAVPHFGASWLGLYDFTPPSQPTRRLIELGLLPWFTDPALELRFLRPLSSLTLALDHALFGRDAALAHVHSTLWMLGLALAAGQLYRRLLRPRAALLAALLLALSPVFGIPLYWLASRHTLVAATFGALALWAWSSGAGARSVALSLLCLVASLLSSESGLVTVPLLLGLELGAAGLRRGLARAALPVAVGLAYLVAYAALGYGAHGSAFYLSPFDAPLAYLKNAALGVPALAAELLLGVPSIAAGLGGRPAQLVFAALGVLSAAGVGLWARALGAALTSRERRALGGLCAGALLGLLALTGAPVSGRVLPLPALATAALWAALLERTAAVWRARREGALGARRGRWGLGLALALGGLVQLGFAPLMRLALAPQFAASTEGQRQLALQADVGDCARGGSLYLVNGSDPTLALYARAALLFHTPEKAGAERLRVLSMAPAEQRLTRTAENELSLEVRVRAERPSTPFERLFRAPEAPLEPGLRVALPELEVGVEAAQDGLFTRARFEHRGAFEDACLLVWRNGRLEHEPLPAVGASVLVQHEPGPMGL